MAYPTYITTSNKLRVTAGFPKYADGTPHRGGDVKVPGDTNKNVGSLVSGEVIRSEFGTGGNWSWGNFICVYSPERDETVLMAHFAQRLVICYIHISKIYFDPRDKTICNFAYILQYKVYASRKVCAPNWFFPRQFAFIARICKRVFIVTATSYIYGVHIIIVTSGVIPDIKRFYLFLCYACVVYFVLGNWFLCVFAINNYTHITPNLFLDFFYWLLA